MFFVLFLTSLWACIGVLVYAYLVKGSGKYHAEVRTLMENAFSDEEDFSCLDLGDLGMFAACGPVAFWPLVEPFVHITLGFMIDLIPDLVFAAKMRFIMWKHRKDMTKSVPDVRRLVDQSK